MKFIIFGILVAILLVADAEEKRRRCKTDDECEEGECCVTQTIFRYKRGVCTPLAQRGERCMHEDFFFRGGQYLVHCPCVSGLACEPTEAKKYNFIPGTVMMNERCVDPVTTLPPQESEAPQET